jgi:hypothetical protein
MNANASFDAWVSISLGVSIGWVSYIYIYIFCLNIVTAPLLRSTLSHLHSSKRTSLMEYIIWTGRPRIQSSSFYLHIQWLLHIVTEILWYAILLEDGVSIIQIHSTIFFFCDSKELSYKLLYAVSIGVSVSCVMYLLGAIELQT